MAISPTAEGFRAASRRPSLTLAEIIWRWMVGATAVALFFFGLFEYLDTLPVTNGELLFLRTRHPYLVGEAIAHILRGSLNRAVMAGLLAVLTLAVLWIIAGSVGRIATVRGLLDYFRGDSAGYVSRSGVASDSEREVTSKVSTDESRSAPFPALVRLNFLRAAAALAAAFGFAGATILAGFASPAAHPQPGLAFSLFLPLAGLICYVWWALNWLLSLAGMFAVRDGDDAVGAISAAVALTRERTGAVFAVSTWTGLAHLVVLVGASTVASMPPLGFAGADSRGDWSSLAVEILVHPRLFRGRRLALYGAARRMSGQTVETPPALMAPAKLCQPHRFQGPGRQFRPPSIVTNRFLATCQTSPQRPRLVAT